MHLQTLKAPAYSNCKMISPSGVFMCRMGRKRVEWYLERELAKVISHDPYTIQLLFEPNGLGNYKDDYYLAEKENLCVICGIQHNLTKHHALPRCFRRYFPENLKRYNSHDVLLVCRDCHEEYEIYATNFKKLLIKNLPQPTVDEQTLNHIRAIKAAKTLLNYESQIPYENALQLMFRIEEHCGDVNDNIVSKLAKEQIRAYDYGKMWEDAVVNIQDYDEFTHMWRKHFVDTMKPKYLPEYWDITRKNKPIKRP